LRIGFVKTRQQLVLVTSLSCIKSQLRRC